MRFSFRDWRFRLFVLLLIPIGLYGIYGRNFFEKNLIDHDRRLIIDPDEIQSIEIREGRWTFPDTEWKMNQSTILQFHHRNDIHRICKIISDAKPKYIQDFRGINGFLTFILHRKVFGRMKLTLEKNYKNESFIEVGSSTFDGTELAKELKGLGEKYGISPNSIPDNKQ